jgi:hypothetical protein
MTNDKLHNKDRAGQIHEFEDLGLLRGISPTDIDVFGGVKLFIEYNTRLFIIGEGKYMNYEMPVAQRQSFESLCNIIAESKNHAMWILLYRHEVHDVNEPVRVKDQYVAEVFSSFKMEWRKPTDEGVVPKFETINGKITMREAIKQIENWCIDNCKFRI